MDVPSSEAATITDTVPARYATRFDVPAAMRRACAGIVAASRARRSALSAGSLTAATVTVDPCAHGSRCTVKDTGRVPRLANKAVMASRATGSTGSSAEAGADPRLHPVRAETLNQPALSRRIDSRTPVPRSAEAGRTPATATPRRIGYVRDSGSAIALIKASSPPGSVYTSALAVKMPPRRNALIRHSVDLNTPLTATAAVGPAATTASATARVITPTASPTCGWRSASQRHHAAAPPATRTDTATTTIATRR